MKAVILAAGEGTRLRPLTLERPKSLVPVGGMPLVEAQLAVLRGQGVDDVSLVGGYMADKLRPLGLPLFVNEGYASSNMVWSLFCAREAFNGAVLVCYGDILYHPGILRAVLDSPEPIAVAVDLNWRAYWGARFADPLADAETLRLGPDGRIVEIGKKPCGYGEIEGQYMGLMKFSGPGLDALCEQFDRATASGELAGRPVRQAYMTDMLQALADAGHRVAPVPTTLPWVEVDTVGDRDLPETRERVLEIHRAAGIPTAEGVEGKT